MLTDELCRAAYNGEVLVAGDQVVCRKGLKILDQTNKNSTDDEVAALIGKYDLQLMPSSPKAYQFGQEFNSCASAAMLALMQSDPSITLEDLAARWQRDASFAPSMESGVRNDLISGWNLAMKRTLTEG